MVEPYLWLRTSDGLVRADQIVHLDTTTTEQLSVAVGCPAGSSYAPQQWSLGLAHYRIRLGENVGPEQAAQQLAQYIHQLRRAGRSGVIVLYPKGLDFEDFESAKHHG